MADRIFVLDTHNFLYRFFYAMPRMTRADGTPVNVVFGMAKLIIGLHKQEKPEFLVATLDSPGGTHRDLLADTYKANRPSMPDELRMQEPLVRELFTAFGVPAFAQEGYEADDLMGTIATHAKERNDTHTWLLSSDKDLCQLVEDGTTIVYDPSKRVKLDAAGVTARLGIPPHQVRDYLAIAGDSSDNIPGLPNYWPKKAMALLAEYGSVESMLAQFDTLPEKLKVTIAEHRATLLLSQELATIHTSAPLAGFAWEAARFASRELFTPEAVDFLQRMELKTLLPKTPAAWATFPVSTLTQDDINAVFAPQETETIPSSTEPVATYTQKEITTQEALQALIQTINTKGANACVGLATAWPWHLGLDTIFLAFENTTYNVARSVDGFTDVVIWILDNTNPVRFASEGTLKAELLRLIAYRDAQASLSGSGIASISGQTSLAL